LNSYFNKTKPIRSLCDIYKATLSASHQTTLPPYDHFPAVMTWKASPHDFFLIYFHLFYATIIPHYVIFLLLVHKVEHSPCPMGQK